MKELKSLEWVRVKGRGWIVTTKIHPNEDLPKVDSEVSIDGRRYKVHRVEHYMNSITPPVRGEVVGIFVEYPQCGGRIRGEDERG